MESEAILNLSNLVSNDFAEAVQLIYNSKGRVVITGMGTLCPLGLTTADFWASCLAGKQAASYIPEQWLEYADYRSRYWAPLPEIDYSEFGISRIDALRLDPVSKLGLVATGQALENAGVMTRPINQKQTVFELTGINPERTGVFLGTGIGGINTTAVSHTAHLFTRYRKDIEEILDTTELNANV